MGVPLSVLRRAYVALINSSSAASPSGTEVGVAVDDGRDLRKRARGAELRDLSASHEMVRGQAEPDGERGKAVHGRTEEESRLAGDVGAWRDMSRQDMD